MNYRQEISKEVFEKHFSCFSEHPVEHNGVVYKTAEHAYHCQRYTDAGVIAEIMAAPTGHDAWTISQTYKHRQRKDFNDRKRIIMQEILRAKCTQHKDVREALVASGDAKIIKHVPDPYWGVGADGNGPNELGNLWMEIRDAL